MASKKEDCVYLLKNGRCKMEKKIVCPLICREYFRKSYKEAIDAGQRYPSVSTGRYRIFDKAPKSYYCGRDGNR